MKVIFLDIDGVLNSEQYYRTVNRKEKELDRFDPKVVALLIDLVGEFSAKLVISSTWRFGALSLLRHEVKKSGLNKYLHNDWRTPQTYPPHRGKEIKLWLDKHQGVENYLILDDDDNMLNEQLAHYVKTDIKFGMQKENFEKARLILSSIISI